MDYGQSTLPCVCGLCETDCKGRPHMHPYDPKRNVELVICMERVMAMHAECVLQSVHLAAQAEQQRAKAQMN